MALGSTDDFTNDELALIPPPDPAEQAAIEAEETAQQQAAAGGQSEDEPADLPAAAAPEAQPPAPAPAPAAEPPKPQGDVRAALRAARRGEARALELAEQERQRREELERRLAELGHKPTPETNGDELTEDEIARIEADYDPLVAKVARIAKKVVGQPAAAPAAAPAQPEFVPPRLPPEFQEVVDTVPELLAWQYDPNQTAFQAAQRADAYLATLDAWRDKPLAERFQEVVRRVNADLGRAAPSPTPNRADPRAVIDQLPSASPNTLSDLPGGGGKQPAPPSNLSRYQAMSEDAILADLMRDG